MNSKLTEKELQDLRSLTQSVTEMDQMVGQLEAKKMSILSARNTKNNLLNQVHKNIAKRYGEGVMVNLASGELNTKEKFNMEVE
jgi:hypothetical protein